MTKKLILISSLLLTFVTITETHARTQICPFVDYFTVSAPQGYFITTLSSDGNIYAAMNDLTHFTTYCRDSTSTQSGVAYLSVSINSAHMCNLQILDGPFEMNPSIIDINCIGKLRFSGIEHEWGTYSYKLKFIN